MAWLSSIFRRKTLESAAPRLPLSELRKRARILVIDDDENAFPTKLLQKEGYNVTYWKSVENLRSLETNEYDIIVLDIHGIVKDTVSKDGGVGVLMHIKKYHPAQIVIAFSGQKYDLSHAEFWKVADDYLGKPSSLLDCKQKIDALLEQRFSAAYYAGILRSLLIQHGASEKKIRKLESLIVKSLDGGSVVTIDQIAKYVGVAKDIATIAGTIIPIILKLLAPAPAP